MQVAGALDLSALLGTAEQLVQSANSSTMLTPGHARTLVCEH